MKLLNSCSELVRYEKQADVREEGAADYKVRNAGSPVTVVAFTGLDRRFTVAVYFLERLLGRFGFNLIIVYDRHEAFYLAGIPGLGADVEESCRSLKRLCDEMNTRHVICLGQSSGGYGALRYAVDLDADHVLAFSPSFVGVLQDETRAEIAGRTGRLFNEDAIDFRPLYGSRETAPRITVVYGADNRYDERSVEALSSIRNTSIRPLAGVTRHGTLSEAVCQGLFFDLVSNALAASGIAYAG